MTFVSFVKLHLMLRDTDNWFFFKSIVLLLVAVCGESLEKMERDPKNRRAAFVAARYLHSVRTYSQPISSSKSQFFA